MGCAGVGAWARGPPRPYRGVRRGLPGGGWQAELAALQHESAGLEATMQLRKKQFRVLLHALHELEASLADDAAAAARPAAMDTAAD